MRHTLPLFPLLIACSGPDDEAEPGASCDDPGVVCTFAGLIEDGQPIATYGMDEVPADTSGLYLVQDLRITPDGNAYLLDWNNHRIREVDTDGIVRTVAGTGFLGDGPPGPALGNSFNHPEGLDFDPRNPRKLAISAWHNSRIEMLDLDAGTIEWIAGDGDRNYNGEGLAAPLTQLDLPSAVAYDETGDNLYFMDQANQLIRVIDAGGTVRNVAGHQRDPGYWGDGGPADEAALHAAVGQAADPSNRLVVHDHHLYTVDTQNNVVRVIDLDTMVIDTWAGEVVGGYGGDGGDREGALFNLPRDLVFGVDGELYIADTENSCVRVIQPDGTVETFAGVCATDGSTRGYGGDGGPATEASFNRPYGVEVDAAGNVYVADTYNHLVRRIAR